VAELYQVEFKGSRREFFFNTYHHSLKLDDYVIIEAEQGEDMGLLTKRIESEVEFPPDKRPRSILRPAGQEDVDRYQRLKENEERYQKEVVGVIRKHGLAMKVVDVECLFDGSKITFYFTADHRVDFRALVRDLASRYRTRIELRQIGVRDEARRIDGYGICGRRQCCNGHIRDFQPISTQHAREQDLSLNPAKISGNCGRLLCCLRYEVELYSAVKQKFPSVGSFIKTTKGSGKIQRIDVFREEAVFTNEEDVLCRVKAEEITERYGKDKSGRGRRPEPETNNTSPEDKAELDKLDAEEGDSKPN
jgi:cell fate regulator YaaT (PSP1 superfamily)